MPQRRVPLHGPEEVLSGTGAAAYGGRFASVGTRAVYLAESDKAASEAKALMSVRMNCLATDDLALSMELGDLLLARSVQGLIFPSAVGRGKNLIVYREHCSADALETHNEAELMKKMRQIVRKQK